MPCCASVMTLALEAVGDTRPSYNGVVQNQTINGCNPITFTFPNFCDVNIQHDQPVSSFPLPESSGGSYDAIIVKVEGNLQTINITWTIKDELTNLVTGIVDDMCAAVKVQGTFEQLEFFSNTFDNKSIEYAFRLLICGTGVCLGGYTPIINKFPTDSFVVMCQTIDPQRVLPTRFTAAISGTTPVTYVANLAILVGNVATASLETVP